jgi:hypothetical protein
MVEDVPNSSFKIGFFLFFLFVGKSAVVALLAGISRLYRLSCGAGRTDGNGGRLI